MSACDDPEGEELWDVFISHASEDKDEIARPLAGSLEREGLAVWFDEFTLRVGDSLRARIDHGLARSKYGVVILSPSFFSKQWPQRELAGLLSRHEPGRVVLPVWHDVDANDVRGYSPVLADTVALRSTDGIQILTRDLLRSMNLPFSGGEITGTWFGPSGRLRLFRVGDLIEGDYDWNGHDWRAHLSGRLVDGVLAFEWWWDFTQERGAGSFRYSGRRLDGEWWLGQAADGERVERSSVQHGTHRWHFTR